MKKRMVVSVLLLTIVAGFIVYQQGLFIRPETAVKRALQDIDIFPQEFQSTIQELFSEIERLEELSGISNVYYDVTFETRQIDPLMEDEEIDQVVITSIRVWRRDEQQSEVYEGYLLTKLQRESFFSKWDFVELVYLPIAETRKGYTYPDDFLKRER